MRPVERVAGQQPDAADQPEVQVVAVQQVDHRRIRMQRAGGDHQPAAPALPQLPQQQGDALVAASKRLAPSLGASAPEMAVLSRLEPGDKVDPAQLLKDQRGLIAGVVTGTLSNPVLTGNEGQIDGWRAVAREQPGE